MSTTFISSLSISSLLLISLASYIVYHLSASLYSTFYGPLCHIPGPKLRAFTKFPSISTLILGLETKTYPALHDEYGPVVRISPKELSYAATSGETWREIYGSKNGCFKDPEFYMAPVKGVASIADAGDRDHARQRGVLGHSFGDKTIREIEGRLKECVGKMLGRFAEEEGRGAKVDLVEL